MSETRGQSEGGRGQGGARHRRRVGHRVRHRCAAAPRGLEGGGHRSRWEGVSRACGAHSQAAAPVHPGARCHQRARHGKGHRHGGRGAQPHRRRGQFGRHRRRHCCTRNPSRPRSQGARRQRRRHLHGRPRRRAHHAHHGRGGHRQHQLGGGAARRQGAQRLWRFQGSGDRADAGAGQRLRPPWHPRQCGGAGPGRHAPWRRPCTPSRGKRNGCATYRCAAAPGPKRSPA